MKFILHAENSIEDFEQLGGGKAMNLARMSQMGINVPPWLCLTSKAFDAFVDANSLGCKLEPPARPEEFAAFAKETETLFLQHQLPVELQNQLEGHLKEKALLNCHLAVRSSGLDEDSAAYSFAGQFSSFLNLKGIESISEAIRRCWASGFSERVLYYRLENNIPITDIRVAVVIQLMVEADVAGVAFSRDPIHLLDRQQLVVDAVFGLGEGLVDGELDADHFIVDRKTLKVRAASIARKELMIESAPDGGTVRTAVEPLRQAVAAMTDQQVSQVAKIALRLEKELKGPQDCEWVIDGDGILYLLQTRPITTLPCAAFFNDNINGHQPILWDNSNIVESYSGVTSPLTFSFASRAYHQVYIQFCQLMSVPSKTIKSHEKMFRNMLGLIRGNIYYNLINWYRLLQMMPSAGDGNRFMETMMGVKQELNPELASMFNFLQHPPKYSLLRNVWVRIMMLWRFIRIDPIISDFHTNFNKVYQHSKRLDFTKKSLPELLSHYHYLEDQVLRRWNAPIINDFLCMLSFGFLKQLVQNWLDIGEKTATLQNDLLCGQGGLESTQPTKLLMQIARWLDEPQQKELKNWLLVTTADEAWHQLEADRRSAELKKQISGFIDKYGFRCVNELKLEENDLHDDPSFVINIISTYLRARSYDIDAMQKRELKIRQLAEAEVDRNLQGSRKFVFYWVLRQTRRAVAHRETLRFARTKIFGIARHLFRAIGLQLHRLEVLEAERDIFYLTVEEIAAYIEGRPTTVNLSQLVELRKREYQSFLKSPPLPERFLTYGAVGISINVPQILAEANLLRKTSEKAPNNNILSGTPCCPGVVEGVVRVAESFTDALGINGEILVTARTDPGWAPLFPSCSGLLIERGSLLSHSAVVARELGLPTIVGISGGLMEKLKTGQRVRIDAGQGEVRIL